MGTQEQQSSETRKWDGIVRRSVDIEVRSFNEEERSVEVVASTDTIDGHGDIVEQSFDLKRFKKNPVILWLHNSFGFLDGSTAKDFLPIGRAEKTKVADGQLETKIFFATEKANPLAEQIFQLFREKILRAVSIGFRPGKVTRTEDNDTGKVTYRLADNELFEISVVPIPSNPDAVAKSLAFEREQFSRIAAKDAAPSGEEEATMAMTADEQKKYDDAISAKGIAESKLGEASTKVSTLEKQLADEKLVSEKAQKELKIATDRAEKAEQSNIESEVDKLVGKKITPAEREEHLTLAKQVGIERVKSLVANRPDIKLLDPVTAGGETIENKAAPTSVDTASDGGSDELLKAVNVEVAKAS